MRIVTWNVRRATAKSAVWDQFAALSADIALLQEVTSFPQCLRSDYDIRFEHAAGKSGDSYRFGSALLVRGTIGSPVLLHSEREWVNKELDRFSGNLFGNRITLTSGNSLSVINVYSPAWPIDRQRLTGIDTAPVQLTQNRDLWVTDLLWDALKGLDLRTNKVVVAGDFNMSETFDAWRGGPRGNREYLDRMQALGLIECLRATTGQLTPTFRNPRDGKIIHQIDHLFVSDPVATYLKSCKTGDQSYIFGHALSDHLPIIADFDP